MHLVKSAYAKLLLAFYLLISTYHHYLLTFLLKIKCYIIYNDCPKRSNNKFAAVSGIVTSYRVKKLATACNTAGGIFGNYDYITCISCSCLMDWFDCDTQNLIQLQTQDHGTVLSKHFPLRKQVLKSILHIS